MRHTGFAVLVNHPLPHELVEQIYDEWLCVLRQRRQVRLPVPRRRPGRILRPGRQRDRQGQHREATSRSSSTYPWGLYPSEVSDAALRYAETAKAIATTLLGWVHDHTPDAVRDRLSMPLPDMMNGSTRTLLRVLRYPPLTGDEPADAVRAAAHEDINLLTVLPAANEPGLQVRDLAGNWHDVPCDFGSIAINAGDMLQLATGGYYPSTTHRVTNPTGDGARRSRLSLPLFLHPADDVVLAEGRTAFSYLRERIAELRSQDLKSAG
ncbi:MAG: 2OG-Fe(II) oxygenase family protein [Ilumatobacteraceae bacterium]